MGMPAGELLARMSSHELSEWMAFYQIEPFGLAPADLRAGIVASTIANANRGKDAKAFRPEDFVPTWDQPMEKPRWESMKSKMMGLFGGS